MQFYMIGQILLQKRDSIQHNIKVRGKPGFVRTLVWSGELYSPANHYKYILFSELVT